MTYDLPMHANPVRSFRTRLVIAVALVGVAPAIGQGAEYCVPTKSIAPTCTIASATPAAAGAAASIAGGNQTIRIGPGTWNGDVVVTASGGGSITVIGAGRGSTRLVGSGSNPVLRTAGVVVKNMTIQRAAGDGEVVQLVNTFGDRLEVIRTADTSFIAATVDGGKLSNSTIKVTNGTGYPLLPMGSIIDTVTVEGSRGTTSPIYAVFSTDATLLRLKVTYPAIISSIYAMGTTKVADSVIVAPAGMVQAISAVASVGVPANVRVMDSTLVAAGGNSGSALLASSYIDAQPATLTATGIASQGFARLGCAGTGNAATSTIDVRSSLSPSTVVIQCPTNPNTGTENLLPGAGLVATAPGFVNFGAGDFRLARGAAAIDRGDPIAPIPAGVPTTDFLTLPRLRDGNGDGIVRRDAGAFEYQPGAVTAIRRLGLITRSQLGLRGKALRIAAGRVTNIGQLRFKLSQVPVRVSVKLEIKTATGYKSIPGVERLTMKARTTFVSVRGKWTGTRALRVGRTYRMTASTPGAPSRRVVFTVRP